MAGLGLQTDSHTWALFAALVLLWSLSIKLVPTIKANGLTGLLYSFWGFTWISFGITFLLRFLVLCYDSVNFGNETYRLADHPTSAVNLSLIFLIFFWSSVCAGLLISNRFYIGSVYPFLYRLIPCDWPDLVLFITCPSLFCTFMTAPFIPVPESLFTPLKLVASLWVIPVCVLWWHHFSGRQVSRVLLFFVLTPAILTVVLNPYREFVLQAALAVMLAAAFAGRRVRFPRLITTALVVYLVSSAVILTYRPILWGGGDFQEIVAERDIDYYWVTPLIRFHAFDSLLLTVGLVPDTFPFSQRDVFAGSIVRGIIPRAIYPEKQASDRGFQFSRTIWAFGNSDTAEAAISPSMPGDLYEAGGIPYIGLGGGILGFCIGLFENTRKRLPVLLRCCLIAYFAPQFIGAVERDFAHVISTLIQTALVANLILLILPAGWSQEDLLPVAGTQNSPQ
jgi:hypothetical protein